MFSMAHGLMFLPVFLTVALPHATTENEDKTTKNGISNCCECKNPANSEWVFDSSSNVKVKLKWQCQTTTNVTFEKQQCLRIFS